MMADVVSQRELNTANTEGFSGQSTPAARSFGDDLGPNPFEESWTGDNVLRPQSEDSDESEAGTEETTAPASDEISVETLPGNDEVDSQVAEPDRTQPVPDTPEVALLRAQHAELQARLDRMEAARDPEQAAVEQGLSWDGLELEPAPEELADYDDFLTKRMTQFADHVWNFANKQAQANAAAQAQAASQDSLRTQIQEMVADPVYADYPTVYPKMKELATSNPNLLSQPNGLKALYLAAGGQGIGRSASVTSRATDPSYANGVKAGLQKVAGKRASAVEAPRPATSNTTVPPTGPRNLATALAQEFAAAQEDARRR